MLVTKKLRLKKTHLHYKLYREILLVKDPPPRGYQCQIKEKKEEKKQLGGGEGSVIDRGYPV